MTASINDVANGEFDYIIVGGGTAGLTLAARLSEDSSKTVLVLEAGGTNLDVVEILRPMSLRTLFANSQYTWQHKAVKQQFVDGRDDIIWHRGRGLGGSSCINLHVWGKPPARDMDDIERLGNPGWHWSNFEKFLGRAEGFEEPSGAVRTKRKINLDFERMGKYGPIAVSYPPTFDEAELKAQEALLNTGLPLSPRPLSGDPTGVFLAPSAFDPKIYTRIHSATSFYFPNQNRKNIAVLVNALVHNVNLVEASQRNMVEAAGVMFEYNGYSYEVLAKEEVIISSGAIQSPKILELSGVGQPDVLARISRPVRVDLPGVGENVQEHLVSRLILELKDDVAFETLDILRDPAVHAKHVELHAKGQGLFAYGISNFAFGRLDQISPKAQEIYEAMEKMVASLDPKTTPPGLAEQYKVTLERFKPGSGSPSCEFAVFPGWNACPHPPELGKRYIGISFLLHHCFSRGTIHAVSKDPSDEPEIDPRYFERSIDLDVMVEMFKFGRKIAATPPLSDMLAREHSPGTDVKTDDEIRVWLKKTFNTAWHTAGSCSMLPREKGGVVDPSLKVYGTTNLRVVDLSVLPLHVAAHTQSVAYAIGEQAADIIKQSQCSVNGSDNTA